MSERQLRHLLPELLTRELLRQGASRCDLPAHCPDSNELTAYVERRLPPSGQESVARHLARCGDCRSAVMLAVQAGLKPGRDAVFSTPSLQPRSWSLRPWSALGGVAAALLVAAVVWHRAPVPAAPVAHSSLAATSAPALAVPPSPARSAALPHRPALARPSGPDLSAISLSAAVAPTASSIAVRPVRPELAAVRPPRPIRQGFVTLNPPRSLPASMVPVSAEPGLVTPAPGANPVMSADSIPASTGASSVNPAMTSAFSAGPGSTAGASIPIPSFTFSSGGSAMPSLENGLGFSHFVFRGGRSAQGWRISSTGQLERFAGKGLWTRVAVPSGTRVLALARQGAELWAGGDHGLLYHSVNGGQNWSAIRLASNGSLLLDSITRIQFQDPHHGTLTTSSGNRWLTLDGGKIWHLVGKVPSLVHRR